MRVSRDALKFPGSDRSVVAGDRARDSAKQHHEGHADDDHVASVVVDGEERLELTPVAK